MEVQVSVHNWLELPMPTRVKLREIFGIKRSQGSLVEGNVVKSDGTTYADLQAITVPKMQEYLRSSEDDFVTLFNDCVAVVANLDKKVESPKPDPTAMIIEGWVERLNHMIFQANSLELSEHLNLLISKLFPNAPRKEKPADKSPDSSAKTKQKRTGKGSNTPKANS